MKIEMVKAASLAEYYKNPRVGNVDAIAESLRVNGQYRPVVVNRGTYTGREMEVIAGNHTLQAARLLGWAELSAVIVDLDEAAVTRIVVADNRTSDLASYEESILYELLRASDDLEGTGYDLAFQEELAVLLEDAEDNRVTAALDDGDAAPVERVVKLALPPALAAALVEYLGDDPVAAVERMLA